MAHNSNQYTLKIISNSKRFKVVLCYSNPKEGIYVEKVLTKDKLYQFISIHIPDFSRYAYAVRRYNFKELCEFVAFQNQYTFLPFNVSLL